MRRVFFLATVLFLAACAAPRQIIHEGTMILQSDAFSEMGDIPAEYTCDGEDVSPQLSWSEFPAQTKSFALSVIDPDAPLGDFVHWLVYDIKKDVSEIPVGGLPAGAIEVANGFGKQNYKGPCPPSGKHRYVFRIYALDVEHLEGVTKENFLETVASHSLDSGQLIGLYGRSK